MKLEIKMIAKGRIVEVGDIPVNDGEGSSYKYKCAAVIVFDSLDDLQNAIRYGAIDAKFRVGPESSAKE